MSGVAPLGRNTAVPDVTPEKDTTTESSGSAVAGPVTSRTTTRSLSMRILGACAGATWKSKAHKNIFPIIFHCCMCRSLQVSWRNGDYHVREDMSVKNREIVVD